MRDKCEYISGRVEHEVGPNGVGSLSFIYLQGVFTCASAIELGLFLMYFTEDLVYECLIPKKYWKGYLERLRERYRQKKKNI